jgi:hypothetical protein
MRAYIGLVVNYVNLEAVEVCQGFDLGLPEPFVDM